MANSLNLRSWLIREKRTSILPHTIVPRLYQAANLGGHKRQGQLHVWFIWLGTLQNEHPKYSQLHTECADSLIPRWLLPSQVPSHATWPQLAGSVAGSDGAGAGLCWRRGESAFTTMLMLGLNSASYCTHRAATAASCRWVKEITSIIACSLGSRMPILNVKYHS